MKHGSKQALALLAGFLLSFVTTSVVYAQDETSSELENKIRAMAPGADSIAISESPWKGKASWS